MTRRSEIYFRMPRSSSRLGIGVAAAASGLPKSRSNWKDPKTRARSVFREKRERKQSSGCEMAYV